MNKNYFVTTPEVTPVMLNADYWIEKMEEPRKIIMKEDEIKEFNQLTYRQMRKKGWLSDLCQIENYPFKLKRGKLQTGIQKLIDGLALQENEYYDGRGKGIFPGEKKEILANIQHLELPEIIEVKFGIITIRSNIRAIPDDRIFARSPETIDVDRAQLTAVSAFTPVAILHISRDKKWFFVQTPVYAGWIKSRQVALVRDRAELGIFKDKDFLVVTGSRIETEPNPFIPDISKVTFQMGDKIPLLPPAKIPESIPPDNQQAQSARGCYAVEVPVRNNDGYLELKPALIASSNDVRVGYLPYTGENIIKQAFKMLGERYGWGGRFSRRDCSRFIMDIYRTAGIILPRDADKQEEGTAGKRIKFEGSMQHRERIVQQLKPGDSLYLKGHVMLYLGQLGNKHYVIHAGSGYRVSIDKPVTVHGVFVMELHQLLKDKKGTYLEALTSARRFENKK